jgi:hypothetical protein
MSGWRRRPVLLDHDNLAHPRSSPAQNGSHRYPQTRVVALGKIAADSCPHLIRGNQRNAT